MTLSRDFQTVTGYTALCAVGNRGDGSDFGILAPNEQTLRELWAVAMGDKYWLDMSRVHSVTVTRRSVTLAERDELKAEIDELKKRLMRIACEAANNQDDDPPLSGDAS